LNDNRKQFVREDRNAFAPALRQSNVHIDLIEKLISKMERLTN